MAESSTTAKKTQLPGMKKCISVSSLAVLCAILIGVCIDLAIFVKVIAITKEPRVSITVEEASLTKFAIVTASPAPALTYNLSVTVGIYDPYMGLKITEPLRAAFFLSDQKFCVARLAEMGEMLSTTTLLSRGPLSGKVKLGSAGIAKYKSENWTRSFQVEPVLRGQMAYKDRYAICKVKGSCLLNLQLAPAAGMAAPAAFQNVKCRLKNC